VTDQDILQHAIALDRERIARDLHDNALQRLYAAGLNLQRSLPGPDLAQQVEHTIDVLDDVILEIRATIFGMRTARTLLEDPVQELRAAVAEAGRVLPSAPTLVVDGPLDDLSADLASELASTCRELLSNIVRHSRAAQCWVHVRMTSTRLTLTVDDDGVGCPMATTGGFGMGNVRDRANVRGGRCSWSTRQPTGTTVTWWVPIPSSERADEPELLALPGLAIDDAA
jgi:signal transduction histidine kinase